MSPPRDLDATTHIVAATVHGRTLVDASKRGSGRCWFVGFHGYAQSAEIMLDLLRQVPHAEEWLVASVQALHPFYNRTDQIVANWMTRQDREHAIADNIAYVDAVIADLEREFGPPRALVFTGFSQGVAMAYRAGVQGRHGGDAILAVAGDLPPELLGGGPQRWPHVRIVTGSKDEWYTPSIMARDVAALRTAGATVQAGVFEGGHEWTSDVNAAAGALLLEVAGRVGDGR